MYRRVAELGLLRPVQSSPFPVPYRAMKAMKAAKVMKSMKAPKAMKARKAPMKAMKAMMAMKGNMRRISWMTTGVDAAVKSGELTYRQTYDGIEEYERALPTNCGEVRFVFRRVA